MPSKPLQINACPGARNEPKLDKTGVRIDGEFTRREWREVEIDTGSHYVSVRLYDDGVLAIDQGDFTAREPGDETPFEVDGDDAAQTVLALTEFLESL